MTPGEFTTLGEALRERARSSSQPWALKLLYHQSYSPPDFQPSGDDLAVDLTYADLLRLSERAAAALQRVGVSSGSRVLLVLPTGLGWLATFFGCQLLGAVPVPLVPPWSVDHMLVHAARMEKVVKICDAAAVVVEPAIMRVLTATGAEVVGRLRDLPRLTPADLLAETDATFTPTLPGPTDAAFIQFTSGSTSQPKGVVISQQAALANCRFIAQRLELDEHDVGCSWLPLFHDMGLIGHLLVPLCSGTPSILLPPEVFARQPRVWLEVLTRYRATMTTAPNSAYDVCATKLTDRDLATLDLKYLRAAMCGGEPILPETLRRFSARFAAVGLQESALTPVYGLAEATLAVTLATPASPPRIESVDRRALEQERSATPSLTPFSASETAPTIEFVCVGAPLDQESLRIVDENGTHLSERQVGLIEARSPSLMTEYFRDPEATRDIFHEGFVRTGDLGFVANGELFIVGRAKETIIKGGRNLHPYDIEAAAAGVAGIRNGRTAAFGLLNAATGTEDLVVLCETKVSDATERKRLERAVKVAVFGATSAHIDLLQLVAPGSLTKTSSGKLQRGVAKERFEAGTLTPSQASWSLRTKAFLAEKFAWFDYPRGSSK